MKKRIVMLLCTAVLALGLTLAPAMASGGPFYPIKVDEYTYGPLDELRISKVYQLSLSDDPSGIPTEDFERGGRRYYLLDMIKEDEIGVDTQDYTDTITMDSDTNDLSKILKQLEPHREVTTEDGHTGLLALDYTSVKVEAKGYKTNTRSLSATRTYPNLAGQDTQYIPKTIQDGGRTLTLQDVSWQTDNTGSLDGYALGDRYTAVATYTGSATSSYVKGYTVTADYTGTVSRIALNKTRYVAIFEGTPLQPAEPVDDGLEATDPAPAASFNWPLLLAPLGLIAAAGGGIGIALFLKRRSELAEGGDEDA